MVALLLVLYLIVGTVWGIARFVKWDTEFVLRLGTPKPHFLAAYFWPVWVLRWLRKLPQHLRDAYREAMQ